MKQIIVAAGLLALTGCGGAAMPALLGAGSVATIATAAATAGTVISDGAKIACAVQAAANDLGKQIPNGSTTAEAISKYAGLACAW
jgi:hypothetical protein